MTPPEIIGVTGESGSGKTLFISQASGKGTQYGRAFHGQLLYQPQMPITVLYRFEHPIIQI